jgi:outer membrane cobalamin receptor
MSGLPAAYHLPRAIVGLEGSYLWRQKVQGNINLNYVGSRAAFDATAFPDSPLNADLAGFLDVRLGATFHYNDQLSAFINISNVLATDYELYLGYNVQRFLGMMGITYRL